MPSALHYDIERYKSHPGEHSLVTIVRALYCHPSFLGIVWYRCSRYLQLNKRNPLFAFGFVVMRILYPIIRIYSGLELSPSAEIGTGLLIGHFGPTVIHPKTKAGHNLTILHGVTIGVAGGGVPTLGDNVSIGIGAIIIGGIHISDNATIGAGAVVIKDVPPCSLALGIPAQTQPKACALNCDGLSTGTPACAPLGARPRQESIR